MSIALLGVPANSAGTIGGVARAPEALRRAGLVERLRRVASVVDLGDVAVARPSPTRAASGIIDAENLAATLSLVRTAILTALRGGHWPILVGGECPILIGALAGCADATGSVPGLLFVDGHEDAWPPKASTTGEAADMELGLLLGRSIDDLEPTLLAQIPRLLPANVIVLGVRDGMEIDAAGLESLAGTVVVHDARAVRAHPRRVAHEAVGRLTSNGDAWWLHVDLDVLSGEALPVSRLPPRRRPVMVRAVVAYGRHAGGGWLRRSDRHHLQPRPGSGWSVCASDRGLHRRPGKVR